MPTRIVSDLERFGALPSQLIDLTHETGPRVLRYLDLAKAPVDGTVPVVFEIQGQPRAFVFDGRGRDPRSSVAHWIRRIAFRGDADWVGVLSPGRLDIYPAALDGQRVPRPLESFAQGPFLFPTLVHARSPGDVPSVRRALLDLLRNSIAEARRQNVDASDSLSLVGRALFWRFLLDRQLLEGINPTDISPKASSLESCLDSKARALRTFEWLENTFNGSLLAFSSPHVASKIPESVYEGIVGNIAHGATIEGQLPLRLPRDWREVNFAHIPVGLLSEVYEAFAHEEHGEKARAESVHYTPRHIAEYVVDEALAALEQVEQPRILDPASGAGVFLVAAFRALVAREWSRLGQKPPRRVVRRILNRQLVGFDINDHALRLSELALYLTAIELDPEQQPRPLDLLRFNALRDEVLFLKEGGITQGSLGPVERRFHSQFDIVLGNPPWTAVEAGHATKKVWVDNTRARVVELLGKERAAAFDFPDANPDLPFVWRATEWAKPKGVIALITHARWLFGQTKTALLARKDLFEGINVTGILNGAALRNSSVWPNISHPFCLLFAINERPAAEATFQFISPELERTPDKTQQHLRLDWNDAHDIAISEVIQRPWILKTRFRGTLFDDAIIDEVVRKGTSFGKYLDSIGTKLRNGYQVGGKKGTQRSARAMLGMPDLKGVDPGFIVDTAGLPEFTRSTLLFPRDRTIYKAPLLLIHESMKVDETAPRASLAFEDVAFDERFDGVSFAGVLHGEQLAAYLQLIIQSSFFTYALLFLDGQYGVEREVVHLATIKSVPIVPWHELSTEHRKQSTILGKRLRKGMNSDLLVEIDEFVSDVFGFSNVYREAILDTLRTALPTTSAKATATRSTQKNERDAFMGVLQSELRELLDTMVLVQELNDTNAPWRFIQVLVGPKTLAKSQKPQFLPDMFIEAANDASASMIAVHVDSGTSFIGVLDQYRYWTRTRARLLASTLVLEKKAHG